MSYLSGSSVSTGFGDLLEGFSSEDYTANIATLNGNPLQATQTPISFQLTQFALTAQPGATEGAVEYTGQIAHARVDGDLLDIAGIRQNQNAKIQDYRGYQSYSNASNYTNLSSSVTNQVSVDSLQTASLLPADSINNNLNPLATVNNLASESAVKSQLTSQNQQTINIEGEKIVDSRHSLRTYVDVNVQDDAPQNNINVLAGDRNVRANANSNLFNNTVITDGVLANNAATSVKPLEQSLTAYSVAPIDEKAVKNHTSVNALPVENKISVASESDTLGSKIPLLKDNLINGSVTTEGKSDVRPVLVDANKINNPTLNTQVVTSEKVVTEDIPVDKLEVIAAKQAYNPLQQNEIKRLDNNPRDESNNIRSSSVEQNYYSDSSNRAINRNDLGVDLTSSVKNQDISQDVKFTPNNIAVDKANIHNPAAPEPLSVSNKVSGLDRSPLQLNANNQVGNGDDLAQQIAWAKNTNTNNIKIAISPEHLGALEINIENDADGLNIQFVTQNATAKEALETFMPRLKDMLEQNGLNLQNANVSQQDKGQSDNAGYSDSEQFLSQSNTDEQFNANSASESNEASEQTNNRLLEAFA